MSSLHFHTKSSYISNSAQKYEHLQSWTLIVTAILAFDLRYSNQLELLYELITNLST